MATLSVFERGCCENSRRTQAGEGPDLHIWGSGNLLQTLMKHDLVDNFWLMIYPITLGEGNVCLLGARSRPRSK
jgi:dihydrofolate reductase